MNRTRRMSLDRFMADRLLILAELSRAETCDTLPAGLRYESKFELVPISHLDRSTAGSDPTGR